MFPVSILLIALFLPIHSTPTSVKHGGSPEHTALAMTKWESHGPGTRKWTAYVEQSEIIVEITQTGVEFSLFGRCANGNDRSLKWKYGSTTGIYVDCEERKMPSYHIPPKLLQFLEPRLPLEVREYLKRRESLSADKISNASPGMRFVLP